MIAQAARARRTSTLFVLVRPSKLIVHGTVVFVEPAEIGVNGTAKDAIVAVTGIRCLARDANLAMERLVKIGSLLSRFSQYCSRLRLVNSADPFEFPHDLWGRLTPKRAIWQCAMNPSHAGQGDIVAMETASAAVCILASVVTS